MTVKYLNIELTIAFVYFLSVTHVFAIYSQFLVNSTVEFS